MVLLLEADDTTFDMMVTFAGLDPDRIHDRQTVTNALAKSPSGVFIKDCIAFVT
jgi:hypothetical protein